MTVSSNRTAVVISVTSPSFSQGDLVNKTGVAPRNGVFSMTCLMDWEISVGNRSRSLHSSIAAPRSRTWSDFTTGMVRSSYSRGLWESLCTDCSMFCLRRSISSRCSERRIVAFAKGPSTPDKRIDSGFLVTMPSRMPEKPAWTCSMSPSAIRTTGDVGGSSPMSSISCSTLRILKLVVCPEKADSNIFNAWSFVSSSSFRRWCRSRSTKRRSAGSVGLSGIHSLRNANAK